MLEALTETFLNLSAALFIPGFRLHDAHKPVSVAAVQMVGVIAFGQKLGGGLCSVRRTHTIEDQFFVLRQLKAAVQEGPVWICAQSPEYCQADMHFRHARQ